MKRGTNGNNAPDTRLTITKYEIKNTNKATTRRLHVYRKARKLEYYIVSVWLHRHISRR